MKKLFLTSIAALFLATGAAQGEGSEHWRCGPYDIRIIPGDSYDPNKDIVLDGDTGFVVRRNGRDAGHYVIRARMYEMEPGGCQIHSCPNGARIAYWEGTTRGNKYDGSGELVTIDGVTHYTELLMPGKGKDRVLRKERHLCRRVR